MGKLNRIFLVSSRARGIGRKDEQSSTRQRHTTGGRAKEPERYTRRRNWTNQEEREKRGETMSRAARTTTGLAPRKGENAELSADLNSQYRQVRKDAITRVIASMTVGKVFFPPIPSPFARQVCSSHSSTRTFHHCSLK